VPQSSARIGVETLGAARRIVTWFNEPRNSMPAQRRTMRGIIQEFFAARGVASLVMDVV
jgi:hypothetical protein